MRINPDHIIISIEQIARNLFQEGETDRADRLAYQIGMLNGKIREICALLDNANDEIKQLQLDLITKDSK